MEMARISAFVISRCANAYCGIKGTGSKFSQDRIGWVLTSKSMFTVKSAYEFRAALSTWSLLIQPSRLAAFFNMPLRQWFEYYGTFGSNETMLFLGINLRSGHRSLLVVVGSQTSHGKPLPRSRFDRRIVKSNNSHLPTDCAEAIKLIHQDDHLGGSLIIVHHIQEFLKKNWCISYVPSSLRTAPPQVVIPIARPTEPSTLSLHQLGGGLCQCTFAGTAPRNCTVALVEQTAASSCCKRNPRCNTGSLYLSGSPKIQSFRFFHRHHNKEPNKMSQWT
ncbi:hypothetical protein V6N11_006879 [Hibiscus sabdariffa]|uniref:Uncharacterized protein n=1 Tax=Hibiscus sabdariffa TaxID=183260 RepID=A0ABR2RSE3_9ROSI